MCFLHAVGRMAEGLVLCRHLVNIVKLLCYVSHCLQGVMVDA